MADEYDLRAMVEKIRALRENAKELQKISAGMPTVDRNVVRILACVKMLEISISDAAEVLGK